MRWLLFMKYRLYTRTRKFWDALWKDIKKAQISIYLEMYIFLDDTKESHNFVELLIKKAQQWIKIVLILDAFWSWNLKTASIKKMQAAGIEIHFFSDWLRRSHKKIIIIDERIAFFWGANIHKRSRHWLDLQMRIEGRLTIKPMIKTFAYTYKMCGGQDKKIIARYKKSLFKKIKLFLIQNYPGNKLYQLTEYYKEKIIQAKKSIKITTPYFIPPRRLLALLDDAVRRGVIVEIIVPADTDVKTLNRINYYYITKVIPLGIRCYAMKKMNHAKMMIIDDKEAVLGSQNMDKLSLDVNYEVWAFFTQKKLVHQLLDIFDQRKKKSPLYTESKIKFSLRWKIVLGFMKIISYFL